MIPYHTVGSDCKIVLLGQEGLNGESIDEPTELLNEFIDAIDKV